MKNFSLAEMTRSATADSLGIDNTPNELQASNIEALVDNLLDPAREALGRVIHVNSGFRSQALNRAVSGVATSQHTSGEAADIELGGKSPIENRELFNWIAENCVFDQLINERGFSWIHVSYRRTGGNRGQTLSLY